MVVVVVFVVAAVVAEVVSAGVVVAVVAWVVDSIVVASVVIGDDVAVVASGPGRQLVRKKVERTRAARNVSIFRIRRSSLNLWLHLLAKPFLGVCTY